MLMVGRYTAARCLLRVEHRSSDSVAAEESRWKRSTIVWHPPH